MIWPAVEEIFLRWNWQYEGLAFCMYADILGLVTTGVGNLLPLEVALILPWKHPDGSDASEGEIREAWETIDHNMEAARRGAAYACTLTDLRLSREAVEALVQDRLEQNAEVLVKRFPDFPDWPADAQLAVLSMAWAMGAGFNFPKFEALINAGDFAGAAAESKIKEAGNPGVVPRNAENKRLLLAAAQKAANGGDYSQLTPDYSGLRDGLTFGEPAPGGEGDSKIPWTSVAIGAAVGVAALAFFAPATLLAPMAAAEALGGWIVRAIGGKRGRLQPGK